MEDLKILNSVRALNKKFDKITAKLAENVKTSEEMLLDTEEFSQHLSKNIIDVQFSEIATDDNKTEVTLQDGNVVELSLIGMFKDFEKVRSQLSEQTKNVQTILTSLTASLQIDNTDAELVASFAELNKAQIECMKLFIQSYKEASAIFCNIQKSKLLEAQAQDKLKKDPKIITAEEKEPMNATNILKRLNPNSK